jgi:hypothetical protein
MRESLRRIFIYDSEEKEAEGSDDAEERGQIQKPMLIWQRRERSFSL